MIGNDKSHHENEDIACDRLPMGWHCTREVDHEGPCAAHQDVRATKTVHEFSLNCPHSDLQPIGIVSKEQREAVAAWKKKHDEEKHAETMMSGCDGEKFRYAGAIGGAYTWCFTGTSIGEVVRVECACGDSIDVSDYNLW